MVMLKKNIQMSKYTLLTIGIGIVSGQNVYADGFYTIIGPDGRLMIVPKKDTSQQLQSQVRNIEKESTLPNKIIENKNNYLEKLQKNNRTGIHGVFITKNGYLVKCLQKIIFSTDDFFEACCARKSAEIANGYHKNHGRI